MIRHTLWVRRPSGKRFAIVCVAAFTLAACSEEKEPGRFANEPASPTTTVTPPAPQVVLDFDGIPGVDLGADTRVSDYDGPILTREGDVHGSCEVMSVDSAAGVRLIVVEGVVEVVELRGDGTTTVAGVGPGSSRSDVLAAHDGDTVSETTNRFALVEIVVQREGAEDPPTLAYVLDEGAQTVTKVRAGRAASLTAWDEGCA